MIKNCVIQQLCGQVKAQKQNINRHSLNLSQLIFMLSLREIYVLVDYMVSEQVFVRISQFQEFIQQFQLNITLTFQTIFYSCCQILFKVFDWKYLFLWKVRPTNSFNCSLRGGLSFHFAYTTSNICIMIPTQKDLSAKWIYGQKCRQILLSECHIVDADQKYNPRIFIIISLNFMAITSASKTGYAICLILTILLVGLHLAVVAEGYIFARDWKDRDPSKQIYFKEIRQESAFIIIASGLTFFISIALLAGLCTDCLSPKLRHTLAAFNLILEFAIAVVVSLRASNNSNLRHAYGTYEDEYDSFRNFYRLSIADAVITFVLEVVYLVVIFFGTLDEVVSIHIMSPVVPVPALSERQF